MSRRKYNNLLFRLSVTLFVIGFISLILAPFVSEYVLAHFSSDGVIDKSNLANISHSRLVLLVKGFSLISLSFALYKLSNAHNIRINKRTSVLLFFIIVTSLLVDLELLLRTNPLLSSQEKLLYSPSYKPSAFSQHRFDHRKQILLNFKTKARARVIENGFSVSKNNKLSFNKNLKKVYILGGSHVYDPNSSEIGGDWINQINNRLSQLGCHDVQVFNAGVPGWRTSDSFGRILGDLHYYKPDYIVICHTYNDLKYFGWASPKATPFNELPASNNDNNEITLVEKVLERSQIYLRMINFFDTRKRVSALDQDFYYGKDTIYTKISPWALRQFQLNLEMLAEISLKIGATPVFTTQPRDITLQKLEKYNMLVSSGKNVTSTRLTPDLLLTAYGQCDSLIQQVAVKYDVPFIDLARSCSGNNSNFRDIIHYADGGGKCATEILTDFFYKKICSEKQSPPTK